MPFMSNPPIMQQRSPDEDRPGIDEIKRRMKLAESMMASGRDSGPIQHWTQGLARLANAYIGRQHMNKAEAEEKTYKDDRAKALAEAMATGDMSGLAQYPAFQNAILNQGMEDRRYNRTREDQLSDYDRNRADAQADYDRDRGDALSDFDRQQQAKRDLAKFKAGLEAEKSGLLSPEVEAQKIRIKQAGATKINNNVNTGSKGQEAVDKEFAKEFVNYDLQGGFADAEKNIQQLKDVHNTLLDGRKNLTGADVGLMPEWSRKIFNQDSVAAQEAVEEVVQRNLRLVLGAQFTEKEGERLIARSYNKHLPEEENAKRLGRLITQIEKAHASKARAAEYFRENGTMAGFEGNMPKMSDFYDAVEGVTPDVAQPSADSPMQEAAPMNGARKARDGKWYIPNPNGGWLRVEQ